MALPVLTDQDGGPEAEHSKKEQMKENIFNPPTMTPPEDEAIVVLYQGKVFCGRLTSCLHACDNHDDQFMGILLTQITRERLPDNSCVDLKDIDGWILLQSLKPE
jgi:hypothetical protein